MSDADPLSDEDRQLLDHLDEEVDDELTVQEVEEHVRDLRGDLRALRTQFRQFRHETTQRLDALEDGHATADEDDQTPLEAYTQIDPEDREETLETSEFIAVTIHEQWGDIAWKLGGGSNYAGETNDTRVGVDTKTKANAKYNPSRLKYRLKKELGWDPAHNQIYRALETLADISGGEEVIDDYSGRVQVMGGRYEYREMATADGKDTKRVLWRVDE